MLEPYEGAEEITSDAQIIRYLRDNYVISQEATIKITEDHLDRLKHAREMGSFVYYIGDQIADIEGLETR